MSAFDNLYFESLFNKIELTRKLTEEDKYKIKGKILNKFCKPIDLQIHNTTKNTIMDTNSKQVLDLFYSKDLIITGNGTLFFNTNKRENVPGQVLNHLLKERKVAKHKMLSHVGESDYDIMMYNMYDVMQKVIKINC